MGRRRKRDKHLPSRVYHQHGAYYYVDFKGKWHRLGSQMGDAYRALADFCPDQGKIETMDDLVNRYQREIMSGYSVKAQKDRAKHFSRIRAVFGSMRVADIRPANIRAFRDKLGERMGRGWNRPTLANRTISTLSHIFTIAVEWDVVDANPCRDVQKPREPKRTRYVDDAEFWAVHSHCPPMHQIAMELALLTGLRREDILKLTRDNVTDEGLLVHTGKTDKSLLFEWTAELRAVIKRAQAEPPQVRRAVICNRDGKRYTGDGFSAIWRRARQRAITARALAEPFRFNDLRAKSASDDSDLGRASQRLGHTTPQTTERFYIRTPRKVSPLRL